MQKYFLWFFIAFFLILLFVMISKKCKPNCSGAFCGNSSNDGCGGTCDCNSGGECVNDVCVYSNCDGVEWDDKCDCDIIPCHDKSGNNCKKTVNGKNVCCYPQDCNNVFCGDDGCGGECGCQEGATCSDPSGGICVNSGTLGYIYNVISSTGIERTNVNSPIECAGWIPENVTLNLSSFPCNTYADCPDGQNLYRNCPSSEDCICVTNPTTGKKYCNQNNVFQWWYYDPSNPSGYNCTKIREGSTVCAIPKSGASAFDIAGNISPENAQCGNTCSISPVCTPSGPDSCCPNGWSSQGNTANCIDFTGITKCCLNNPNVSGYTECMALGLPTCENVPDAWWPANIAEISNGVCGMKISGPPIHVNSKTLQNPSFTSACENKNSGDQCSYNDGNTSYDGICRTCADGSMKCFPDTMCTSIFTSASQPGICTTKNVCS